MLLNSIWYPEFDLRSGKKKDTYEKKTVEI